MTESRHEDRVFFDTFMLILGGLVAFSAVIYVIARIIAANTQVAYLAENEAVRAQLAQRIEPVGRVALAGEEPPGPEQSAPTVVAQAEPAEAAMTGPQVYNSACLACHASGAAGAPMMGDKAVWEPRLAKGMEVLVKHAIEGFQGETGFMPPKGGRTDLSDEEVTAAAEYMVEQSR
ncbi:MAG TPA: c-type cytochrome [Gammaproteobacteria bacterium]|nr:c-type cytochrome [Gammaproteobacteria bacterium]